MTESLEERRLKALAHYRILDTAAEQDYDGLTLLASAICHTPIALISLLDENRQWFKSKVGIDATETPRAWAFCDHAIQQEHIFEVNNACEDQRFKSNPLVTGSPHIRFYAGMPLRTESGDGLGTLCVIDRVPRQLTEAQKLHLRALATQVIRLLELRRCAHELAGALEKLETVSALIPICSYCKSIRNDAGYWERVESYIAALDRTVQFSHGICPACVHKFDESQ